ncbi:hypothetical protein [Sphingosinicella sp. BN140058]|uniref:hypothetical protein n=1 Tax=Sphingosinicella sp. BN140058 TaxID=1892855 RepID=UPI0010111CF1|nr:hypothetical protein [Sphingosinicella sp. BN140058]QAY75185.1 hypothetical protein ETR14_00545 [Sphingosinicella sp. BN140058]
MKKTIMPGFLFGSAALLTSCLREGQDAAQLVLNVKRDGGGCRVMLQGERVTSERLMEIGRQAKTRRAIVLHDKETPYKCIGGAVFTLQRAGINRVDVAVWDES